MFDRIVYIGDHFANVKLKDAQHLTINLMNLHLVFEDKDKKIFENKQVTKQSVYSINWQQIK